MDARDRLARWVLIASIIGGVSYVAAWGLHLPPVQDLAWKGTGVGLLAVYAALKARSLDGWLLTAVMTFGVLGDVLLGVNFIVGALAFLAGHAISLALYVRNRRQKMSRSQTWLAVLIIPATLALAWMLSDGDFGVASYATFLGAMAAMAWASRFPRFKVGIGALMFVASDLLIFGRMSHHVPDTLPIGLAVWGLYFFGQLLICMGVVGALKPKI